MSELISMRHQVKLFQTNNSTGYADEKLSEQELPTMEYWLSPSAPAAITNALTIDLEDWPIAVLGPHHEVSDRVVENTKRCLQILQWHHVKATFFVLGKVAERQPTLIREVAAAGHEIASHGYGHELLTTLDEKRFIEDARRSIKVLTDIVGQRPVGYRAPAFSIIESTRWAGPILADLGFVYSSSIFPIRHPRYGIPDAPAYIHRWKNCRLIECPPATIRLLGRNWPVGGGGYFRLLPSTIIRQAIRQLNHRQQPAVLYLHPYELDVDGITWHRRQGVAVGWKQHLTQRLFRSRIERRWHCLCEQFRFTTLRELLKYAT